MSAAVGGHAPVSYVALTVLRSTWRRRVHRHVWASATFV